MGGVGMSQTAISRIWRAFSRKPHRTETGLHPAADCSSRALQEIPPSRSLRAATSHRHPKRVAEAVKLELMDPAAVPHDGSTEARAVVGALETTAQCVPCLARSA